MLRLEEPPADHASADHTDERVGSALATARRASRSWSAQSVEDRVAVIGRLRRRLGDAPSVLARTAEDSPWRSSAAETLTAEVLPLLDACRFLETEAARLLAPRRPGWRRRPAWLFGSRLEIRREPFGVVLIIGPSNYPILLAGVQIVQALVAGNAVLVKPGRGGSAAMRALADGLAACGLPDGVLQVLDERVETATAVLDLGVEQQGVDKVVLTGSRATGLQVLERLARTATPAVMELSGRDAAIVLQGADLELTARAVAFGLSLNGGFTCIAPRRLLVADAVADRFTTALAEQLADRPAVRLPVAVQNDLARAIDDGLGRGGQIVAGALPDALPEGDGCRPVVLAGVPEDVATRLAEIPAPVSILDRVPDGDAALALVDQCPYRLGVAIFGPPGAARALARRADVGVAVVNDVIVPTADPRVPFGGRGDSGFGVTRGAEGLLEMTTVKSVIERKGRLRPHYDPIDDRDAPLFEAFVGLLHGSGLASRWGALKRLVAAGRQRQARSPR